MASLNLFYPENDLALARDIPRYTAPPAATQLRRSGYALPLWYADRGDRFYCEGINADWIRRIRDAFDTGIEPFDHITEGLSPAPWGWSKGARQFFADLGYDSSRLPSDAELDAIRALSHRRTAAEVSRLIAGKLPFEVAPPAQELRTVAEINDFINAHPQGTVLKLPWSSSGRGLVATDPVTARSQSTMFEGMLRRQGSVMAEPRHKKVLDFAMLFNLRRGHCSFAGLSVFTNVQFGTYAGNRLASDSMLMEQIASLAGSEQPLAVRDALIPALEQTAGENYEGSLGVDMMIVDSESYRLAPVTEINFRMTMGHLCRRFYDRYAAEGSEGSFSIRTNTPADRAGVFDASMSSGRMHSGTLDMAPPGSLFSFIVRLGDCRAVKNV